MSEQCSAKVQDRTGWHPYDCQNRGKVENNGKWYCGVHDPAKQDERDRKYIAESNAREAARKAAAEAQRVLVAKAGLADWVKEAASGNTQYKNAQAIINDFEIQYDALEKKS